MLEPVENGDHQIFVDPTENAPAEVDHFVNFVSVIFQHTVIIWPDKQPSGKCLSVGIQRNDRRIKLCEAVVFFFVWMRFELGSFAERLVANQNSRKEILLKSHPLQLSFVDHFIVRSGFAQIVTATLLLFVKNG